MKKILGLLLVVLLLLGLAGCGEEEKPDPTPVDLGSNAAQNETEEETPPPVYKDYPLPHSDVLTLRSTAAEIVEEDNVSVQLVLNATVQYSFNSNVSIADVSFSNGYYTIYPYQNYSAAYIYYSTNYSVDDVLAAKQQLEDYFNETYGERDQNGQWPLYLSEDSRYAVSLIEMENPEDATQRRLVVTLERTGPEAAPLNVEFTPDLPTAVISSLYAGMSYSQVSATLGGAGNRAMQDGDIEVYYWAKRGADDKNVSTMVCCYFVGETLRVYNVYSDVYIGS